MLFRTQISLILFVICLVIKIEGNSKIRVVRPRGIKCGAKNVTRSKQEAGSNVNVPDHPEWSYLNSIPWYKHDPTQQDHARFHSYLSMSAYGDYRKECRTTFTKGFKVLEDFSTDIGQTGFTAWIPEMKKIVIVFKGYGNYPELSWVPTSVEDFVSDCTGCKVAQGIRDLYLSTKRSTNDFAIARKAVETTGLHFSVTGHGIGGAVAALAGLDLGARNLVHYSHNQGTPRVFNYAAVVRYDNLFQVLSGQSLVHDNDYMVQSIPVGQYYHLGTKVQVSGPNQRWLVNCYGSNENSTCLGNGSSVSDHKTYFTPITTCGSADKGF
ncbi:hypothetical protein CROQUDRAFT_659295 [Cronartium quercuum f. sp. fusiforme G11]|uniref:Fungal lipase-type domain-containing protein n=1 Tax=Cronartium quercuum f. sp. fusiforme G11 TaxID=708437 RepID=A0A9P6NK07_9BASI|nr:hypothetical protein CROQUDRAFT_659295 [Cronartium quercuum f. sp. fusiforme G11]